MKKNGSLQLILGLIILLEFTSTFSHFLSVVVFYIPHISEVHILFFIGGAAVNEKYKINS